MELLKWGIIGPGNIARTFVNDLSYTAAPQKVTAVLGHNTQSTYDLANEYNVGNYYTRIGDFLNNKNIDAVYIATPHPQHFKQAIACLENGLPVLCEKPMTINAEQCRKLIEASEKNNTFLME
jgi:predicted dehydrogenase